MSSFDERQQRENLTKVDKVQKKAAGNPSLDVTDQLNTLRANITFVQENINDCQSNIMSFEESKSDEQEPSNIFTKCSNLEEAKYLLEHFLNMVISKGLMSAQKNAENKELIAKLHQDCMDATFQRDMLQTRWNSTSTKTSSAMWTVCCNDEVAGAGQMDGLYNRCCIETRYSDSDTDSLSEPSSLSASPIDSIRKEPPPPAMMAAAAMATMMSPTGPMPSLMDSLTTSNTSISRVKDKGCDQCRPGPQSKAVTTHTADGHHKAVLSVFATEDLMFSSSKDRMAKIWDLTVNGHPNNRPHGQDLGLNGHSPPTRLIYTVSTYFIKVWDARASNKCIRTLLSSGPVMCDQGACPPGETVINDIALNSAGSVLYSATTSASGTYDQRRQWASCRGVTRLRSWCWLSMTQTLQTETAVWSPAPRTTTSRCLTWLRIRWACSRPSTA